MTTNSSKILQHKFLESIPYNFRKSLLTNVAQFAILKSLAFPIVTASIIKEPDQLGSSAPFKSVITALWSPIATPTQSRQ